MKHIPSLCLSQLKILDIFIFVTVDDIGYLYGDNIKNIVVQIDGKAIYSDEFELSGIDMKNRKISLGPFYTLYIT